MNDHMPEPSQDANQPGDNTEAEAWLRDRLEAAADRVAVDPDVEEIHGRLHQRERRDLRRRRVSVAGALVVAASIVSVVAWPSSSTRQVSTRRDRPATPAAQEIPATWEVTTPGPLTLTVQRVARPGVPGRLTTSDLDTSRFPLPILDNAQQCLIAGTISVTIARADGTSWSGRYAEYANRVVAYEDAAGSPFNRSDGSWQTPPDDPFDVYVVTGLEEGEHISTPGFEGADLTTGTAHGVSVVVRSRVDEAETVDLTRILPIPLRSTTGRPIAATDTARVFSQSQPPTDQRHPDCGLYPLNLVSTPSNEADLAIVADATTVALNALKAGENLNTAPELAIPALGDTAAEAEAVLADALSRASSAPLASILPKLTATPRTVYRIDENTLLAEVNLGTPDLITTIYVDLHRAAKDSSGEATWLLSPQSVCAALGLLSAACIPTT